MIQRGSSGKKLFDKIPSITIADSKKKKKERGRDPSISYLKSETLTPQSRNISFEDERSVTADEISRRG